MTNCSISTCSKLKHTRGYCNTHYRRLINTGDLSADVPIGSMSREQVHTKCTIKKCTGSGVTKGGGKQVFSKGYCNAHYLKFTRHGDPLAGQRTHEKHGMATTSEYSIWNNMIARCNNPSSIAYEKYGGKGIKVCDRWADSFISFYEDMGDRPSPEHSLDRIDGAKGYFKENCRWADWHTQSVNTILQARNKTGYKGVFLRPDTGKYSAKITHYGRVIYIGTNYKTLEEAISARLMAESIYWQ